MNRAMGQPKHNAFVDIVRWRRHRDQYSFEDAVRLIVHGCSPGEEECRWGKFVKK